MEPRLKFNGVVQLSFLFAINKRITNVQMFSL